MIVVTGAAGFIGSCLIDKLNSLGHSDIIIVDDFSKIEKQENYIHKKFQLKIERVEFEKWLNENPNLVSYIFHIGARTDTTEFNKEIFDVLNIEYTKMLWNFCVKYKIPFVYASSAATYGGGEFGYVDDESQMPKLQPLNPYGWSKQDFDIWALKQTETPPSWIGLKFFNVYGPNEYHKNRMASVIMHSFNQIKANGKVKLFRSHRLEYKDGWQLRDFVYVKDVVEVCSFLYQHKIKSGIYNLGTGTARSFYDLAVSTFNAMNATIQIDFIDMPEDIRDKYQYFTEANMTKLIDAGYKKSFTSLEDGVADYVKNYLIKEKYL